MPERHVFVEGCVWACWMPILKVLQPYLREDNPRKFTGMVSVYTFLVVCEIWSPFSSLVFLYSDNNKAKGTEVLE